MKRLSSLVWRWQSPSNDITHTFTHTHTHAVVVHLTLSLRCQVGAPADDLAVFAPPTEQSAALQGAQGEHAAFVGSGLSHDLKGFWEQRIKSDGQHVDNLLLMLICWFIPGKFSTIKCVIQKFPSDWNSWYRFTYEAPANMQHLPLAPLPSVLISAADFPQVRMFPSESPVRTSPVRLNTKHWMNLGFLYFYKEKRIHTELLFELFGMLGPS